MNLFSIDAVKCKRDGICVAECPLQLIEMLEAASIPTPTADAAERCIQCGHCVAVCPQGALRHSQLPWEDFPTLRPEESLGTAQAEHFLRSRRSIRSYKDIPVEREKLARLIDIAHYAPTGGNSQLVHWLVVSSRVEVAKLTVLVVDLIRELVKAKHPMAVKYRLDKSVSAWDQGMDTISRGAPALVVTHAPKEYGLAAVDATSALSYFDLAAPTLGLGCCWAGFFMIAAGQYPPLQQALALPEGHAACGMMMVGYPKFKYQRLVPRKVPVITWK